ncbi:MAG: hypothetical protein ACLUOI_20245 [Eisenbergiella sp.]
MEYDGEGCLTIIHHLMMRKICRRICEEPSEDAGEMRYAQKQLEDSGLDDLIGVMLYNEMYRRRCQTMPEILNLRLLILRKPITIEACEK